MPYYNTPLFLTPPDTGGGGADIALARAWASYEVTDTFDVTTTGSNQLLIVFAAWEVSSTVDISSFTIDGEAGTRLVTKVSVVSGFENAVECFYWTDSQLSGMSDAAPVVTYSGTAPVAVRYLTAIFENCAQSSLPSDNDSGTSTSNPYNYTGSVSVPAGGLVMQAWSSGNGSAAYTAPTGFTEQLDVSVGGTGASFGCSDRLYSSSATATTDSTLSSTNRSAVMDIALAKA